MEPITAILLGLAGVGVVLWQRAQRRRRWAGVAEAFGLHAVGGRWLQPLRIVGRTPEGLDVGVFRADGGGSRRRRSGMRYLASGPGILPADLVLDREGLMEKLRKVVTGQDVQVGDPAFDALVAVRGRPAEVISRLDHDTRASARVLVEVLRGRVRDGTVEVVDPRGLDRADVMIDRLGTVLAVARGLAAGPASLPERLAVRAARDRLPGVRERALELLAQDYPGDQTLEVLLAAAARDPDPALRLRVAKRLGWRGIGPLLALAGDGAAGDAVRAEALAYAARHGPREEVQARVDAWLADAEGLRREPAFAATLADAAGRLGLTHHADLLERLTRAGPGAVRGAAGGALVRLGRAEVGEAALIEVLGEDDAPVAVAAARALGELGSVRAVAPLLARAKGWLAPGDVRDAARAAVEAIQARLQGAGAGQLSLVEEAAAGGLSLSHEEGALSLEAAAREEEPA